MGRFYELTIAMDEAEDGTRSWLVTAPEFPEVTTFGDTQPEACLNGIKAIEEAIASRISDSEDIPHPLESAEGIKRTVEVPLLTYLKCALYMICRGENVSRAELARRLDWHREQVDRLFRIDHKSQLDQIEAAFKAVGVSIGVDLPFPAAA